MNNKSAQWFLCTVISNMKKNKSIASYISGVKMFEFSKTHTINPKVYKKPD